MCGAYSTSYNRTEQTICVVNPMCRQHGFTVVPYGNNGNYANFEQQYRDMEQDMCSKETTRWSLLIGDRGNGTYYVEFSRKDKATSDSLNREFETFEQALAFANEKHKELK
jgi:hypothetical protein